MIEIEEVLRCAGGHSLREVTRLDGKTIRRCVQAEQAAGAREGRDGQLTEDLLGAVVAVVCPDRLRGSGASSEAIAREAPAAAAEAEAGPDAGQDPYAAGGAVVVPYRTLHRFAVAGLGFGDRQATVRVADGNPGKEVQADFGRLGLVAGRPRADLHSWHMSVYPTLRQTLSDVVAGLEAALAYVGGVFAVVAPDNMKAIVDQADATDPRFTGASASTPRPAGSWCRPARGSRWPRIDMSRWPGRSTRFLESLSSKGTWPAPTARRSSS